MNAQAFKERVATVLREELTQPETWLYTSFADDVFKGVVIIKGHGITDALSKCNILGINPGGQVICVPLPDEIIAQVPETYRNRLLSKIDILELWPDSRSLGEHEREDEPG